MLALVVYSFKLVELLAQQVPKFFYCPVAGEVLG